MEPIVTEEIDLSERSEVVEKEINAEIELFQPQSQLATVISVPIHITLSNLQSKAAELFRDGEVELYFDDTLVDPEKTLEEMSISVGDKKRVEVRYKEREQLIEIDSVRQSEQEVIYIFVYFYLLSVLFTLYSATDGGRDADRTSSRPRPRVLPRASFPGHFSTHLFQETLLRRIQTQGDRG